MSSGDVLCADKREGLSDQPRGLSSRSHEVYRPSRPHLPGTLALVAEHRGDFGKLLKSAREHHCRQVKPQLELTTAVIELRVVLHDVADVFLCLLAGRPLACCACHYLNVRQSGKRGGSVGAALS